MFNGWRKSRWRILLLSATVIASAIVPQRAMGQICLQSLASLFKPASALPEPAPKESTPNTLARAEGCKNCVRGPEEVLNRQLTPAELAAIEAAHLVGIGENGVDGLPARAGYYTLAQLKLKAQILEDAKFNRYERRLLMERSFVGLEDGGVAEFSTRFNSGDHVILRSKSGNFYAGYFLMFGHAKERVVIHLSDLPISPVTNVISSPYYVERLDLAQTLPVGGKVTITSIRGNPRDVIIRYVDPTSRSLRVTAITATDPEGRLGRTFDYRFEDVHKDIPIRPYVVSANPVSEKPQTPLPPGRLGSYLDVQHSGAAPTDHVKLMSHYGMSFPDTPSVQIGETKMYFSKMFTSQNRLFVLAIVEVPGKGKFLRAIYQSGSQGGFRVLPARNTGIRGFPGFDKGIGEQTLDLPYQAQRVLAEMAANPKPENYLPGLNANESASLVDGAVKFNRDIEQYLKYMESSDYPGKLQKMENISITADRPEDVKLINLEDGADFKTLLSTYKTASEVSGKLTAYVFKSANGKWIWTYFIDANGSAWIGSVTSAKENAITTLGVPEIAPGKCISDMLSPRWEYFQQINDPIHNPNPLKHPSPSFYYYGDNSPYVSRLPEVVRFRAQFKRP